ncbi:MAG: hypothetical protein ACRDN8_26745, partial [Thermoleophilaceae bacterium]
LTPIRIGLVGTVVTALLLPQPGEAVLMAAAVLAVIFALGVFWAPAMAMLSDASEDAGLDQALAFSISNLAWAAGHLLGSGGGAALADITTDAVPYGLLGLACAATLAGVIGLGRSAPARSSATR